MQDNRMPQGSNDGEDKYDELGMIQDQLERDMEHIGGPCTSTKACRQDVLGPGYGSEMASAGGV